MPIATAHRPAIARTPKSPTFLPYSTVPVTQPPAVSLNLGMYFIEQQWYIWGPKDPKVNASQPWIKGYNGEVELGLSRSVAMLARIWIDSEMKEAMGR